jgi:acyl carrier protein
MTDDEILSDIQAVIAEETSAPQASIGPNSSAATIPGWDSLAHTRIVMSLEFRLGVTLDMDATYRAPNVQALADLAKAALSAQGKDH